MRRQKQQFSPGRYGYKKGIMANYYAYSGGVMPGDIPTI
jgi:hypothetical protein